LALGVPDDGYPWHWSVAPWLSGQSAYDSRPADFVALARELARFVMALHSVDAHAGPPADAPLAERGGPLATRHDAVLAALGQLKGVIDTATAAAAWSAALEAPAWGGAPVWIHGDLQQTNLLVENGRLTGVIDWGGLGVGDPAADLIPSWSMFSGPSRDVYRDALAADDGTWARGKGWALSVGLIALPYYADTNPVIVEWARRSVEAVVEAG
jgi:aminoglycoside phosphotransferase (APT) family kinase protein